MKEPMVNDLVPFSGGEGTKNIPVRKICVKVYFNEEEFLDVIKLAEKAGIRSRGLKPFRLKPHGFADERVANTKGLVKFIKQTISFWDEMETERKDVMLRLRKEAEKYGLKIEVR